jgi:hypothetical protein
MVTGLPLRQGPAAAWATKSIEKFQKLTPQLATRCGRAEPPEIAAAGLKAECNKTADEAPEHPAPRRKRSD